MDEPWHNILQESEPFFKNYDSIILVLSSLSESATGCVEPVGASQHPLLYRHPAYYVLCRGQVQQVSEDPN